MSPLEKRPDYLRGEEGMDARLLVFFQRQILVQCHFFVTAARELDAMVDGGPHPHTNVERSFYAIQNLLNAAANISKALFRSNKKDPAPRKPLRESLGVTDDSPLQSVHMRNQFEHFDERLDEWWQTSKTRSNIDLNLGPVHIFVRGMDENDYFRNYDPGTQELRFWGQKFNLRELGGEVERIRRILEP